MDGSIRIGEHRKDGLKLSFCFSVIKSKLQKKEKGVMIVYARIKKSAEEKKRTGKRFKENVILLQVQRAR